MVVSLELSTSAETHLEELQDDESIHGLAGYNGLQAFQPKPHVKSISAK